MTSPSNEAVLYSEFGVDSDLAELVKMFVEEMPDRIEALRKAFNGDEREPLQRLAHQLKGSSGSYGFHQLTPHAARLETAANDDATEREIEATLEELMSSSRPENSPEAPRESWPEPGAELPSRYRPGGRGRLRSSTRSRDRAVRPRCG